MKTELIKDGSTVTAMLSGDIDHHSARGMREDIDRYIELSRPSMLILNFSKVSFMDSSGIGLIMGRYKLMRELGGNICVRHNGGAIGRMLSMASLSRIGIDVGGEKNEKTDK